MVNDLIYRHIKTYNLLLKKPLHNTELKKHFIKFRNKLNNNIRNIKNLYYRILVVIHYLISAGNSKKIQENIK